MQAGRQKVRTGLIPSRMKYTPTKTRPKRMSVDANPPRLNSINVIRYEIIRLYIFFLFNIYIITSRRTKDLLYSTLFFRFCILLTQTANNDILFIALFAENVRFYGYRY